MAKAVVARQQGDIYQARFFWLAACRLFQGHTNVVRVGFEADSASAGGFDDVTETYAPPIVDEYGNDICGDYYQVKYHVDHARAVTYEALMDPAFVGREDESLLQRLHKIQKRLAPHGMGSRFHMVTPWGIDPNDRLRLLVDNNGGRIRLDKLFGKGFAKIRNAWRKHLNLDSDEELRTVLRPLRIQASYPTLEGICDPLSDKLQLAGLAPLEAGKRTNQYEVLIQRLHSEGRTQLDKADLLEICMREELVTGSPHQDELGLHIGVRSFIRGAEHLEDETNSMVCFLRYFEGRHIIDPSSWAGTLFPDLCTFLQDAVAGGQQLFLHLDTHAALAFATGYCLDPKQGASIAVVQRLRKGKVVWNPDVVHDGDFQGLWEWGETQMAEDGRDTALAVSVTQDVRQDVEDYVSRELPEVGRILEATIQPRPHSTSVRDGTHALKLAQSLASEIRSRRTKDERGGKLHLFIAAPNAVTCFLGQHAKALGPVVVYEFDFDSAGLGAYTPVLAFPPEVLPSLTRS